MVLKLTAFKVNQPIGELYLAVISSCRLMDLAKADIRRISDRGVEEYSGIQRGLSTKRSLEIKKYIETVDSTFPNTVILNLSSEKLVDIKPALPSSSNLEIPNLRDLFLLEIEEDPGAFQIIDGQHRISGFTKENCEGFELLATIFIDLLVEDQAYIFSVINLNQTPVNRSHVYDLFDLAETRSPEKTAHIVTKMLNSEQTSPFFQKIKLLGITPRIGGEILYKPVLSQGAFVKRMLDLISKEPKQDRNDIKAKRQIHLKGNEINEGLIFRQFFVEEKDWAIYKTMFNYFTAIRENFKEEWLDQTNPLSRSIGYGALMKLLVPLFQSGFRDGDISLEYFNSVFSKAYQSYRQDSVQINFENFPASGFGENQLFNKLKEWCSI